MCVCVCVCVCVCRSVVAFCPTSNLFLGSGLIDIEARERERELDGQGGEERVGGQRGRRRELTVAAIFIRGVFITGGPGRDISGPPLSPDEPLCPAEPLPAGP